MTAGHGATAGRPTDRIRGPLTGVPATVKILGLLAFLVAAGLTPNRAGAVLAGFLAGAVAAAVVAAADWRSVARRLTLDVPLVVLAVVQAVFGHGPDVDVAGLSLSRPGLESGLGVLAKATIGVVAVSAVAASTTVAETLAALRRLHVPQWFCRLLALAFRQVDVLRAELDRVRLAVALRSAGTSRRAAWAVSARSLGCLFVRATERADRLALAAELRGGDGETAP